METQADSVELLARTPLKFAVRIDQETKQASVIDTIRGFTGLGSNHAGQMFGRLGREYVERCPNIKINGIGRLTPVAPAHVLVEIIWALPNKAAKEFRRESAVYICRLLGADQSLIQEVELRGATTPQAFKEFFVPPATARNTVTIFGQVCEVPSESDPEDVKKRLHGMMDMVITRYNAETERQLRQGREDEAKLQEFEEECKQRIAMSRATTKRKVAEIESELQVQVTKNAGDMRNAVMALGPMMHPALRSATLDALANRVAEVTGVSKSTNQAGNKYLEDFSTMIQNLGNNRVDSKRLCAIGKAVRKAFGERYPNQEPEKVERHVNGAMRLVNVYLEVDRPWIEDLVRTELANT
jgi:hypothetical protein